MPKVMCAPVRVMAFFTATAQDTPNHGSQELSSRRTGHDRPEKLPAREAFGRAPQSDRTYDYREGVSDSPTERTTSPDC